VEIHVPPQKGSGNPVSLLSRLVRVELVVLIVGLSGAVAILVDPLRVLLTNSCYTRLDGPFVPHRQSISSRVHIPGPIDEVLVKVSLRITDFSEFNQKGSHAVIFMPAEIQISNLPAT
jgi:hypothetical protein